MKVLSQEAVSLNSTRLLYVGSDYALMSGSLTPEISSIETKKASKENSGIDVAIIPRSS